MLKKMRVVMLPTNQIAPIIKYKSEITYCGGYLHSINLSNSDHTHQHLYVLSDEDIKVKDWVYCDKMSTFGKVILETKNAVRMKEYDTEIMYDSNTYKKVIATTNPELGLPCISQRFIKKYCDMNGNINKVNVRTEIYGINMYHEDNATIGGWIDRIYTNENNEISIKPLRDTYTREEVIEIVKACFNYSVEIQCPHHDMDDSDELDFITKYVTK